MGRRLGSMCTWLRARAWWQWAIVAGVAVAIGIVVLVSGNGSGQSPWYLEAPTLEEDGYVVQLSDTQRAKCASAYYTIIMSSEPDNVAYYPLLDGVPVSVDGTGRIVVPADPQVLKVVDEQDFDSMSCGIRHIGAQGDVDLYETDGLRMCAANVIGGYTMGLGYENTTLTANVDRRTGDVSPSIRRSESLYPLGEEVTRDQFAYYHAVQFLRHSSKSKARAADGSLAPIAEWPEGGLFGSGICSYDTSPTFKMAPVSTVKKTCYLQVVVRDADGVAHGSELVRLKTDVSEGSEEDVRTVKTKAGELEFRLDGDHAVLERYVGEDESVTVPETVDGLPVTIVGSDAFAGYDEKTYSRSAPFVREVVLPDSVEYIASRAFAETQLTRFEIPSGLKRLAPGAFSDCESLKSFVQEKDNGTTSVRDGVLYSADGSTLLSYPNAKGTEFAVPDGVTAIGPAAFAGSHIHKVVLPDSLRVIDACAFLACGYLLQPVLPAGLERIGASAFAVGWASLSDTASEKDIAWEVIDIGSQVSFVGSSAFERRMVREFRVDEENAWYDDAEGFLMGRDGTLALAPDGLEGALVVPDGTTTLSADSLRSYSSYSSGKNEQLIDLFLPASLQRIEDDALPTRAEQSDMSSSGENTCGARFHVPRGSWAESYAKQHDIEYDNVGSTEGLQWKSVQVRLRKADLTFRRFDDHAVLAGVEAHDAGHIAIPDQVEGVPVTTIGVDGNDVASGVVKTIVIPHTVTRITEGALLSQLQHVRKFEVDGRNTQYTVREGAIYSADGKTLVVCPGTVAEEYRVPEGTTAIAARAFSRSNVVSVTLPEGLTRIGEYAFDGCSKLTSVDFPTSLTFIGPSAFQGASQLTVRLNEGLETVSKYTFASVASYDSLEIPNSVMRVGNSAFSSVSSVSKELVPVATRKVRIGSGLEELGSNVFDGLDFDTFDVSSQNEHFKADGPFLLSKDGRTLWACASTVGPQVHVPDGVEEIDDYVFATTATDLTDVYLPESVLRIGTPCFSSTQKESVTLHCAPGSEAALYARVKGFKVVEE